MKISKTLSRQFDMSRKIPSTAPGGMRMNYRAET